MASTKLTLSADADIVEQAKQLARRRGTSLSAMFDRYVRSVAQQENHTEPLGPMTTSALGLVSLPKGKSDSEMLEEALAAHLSQ